MDSSDNVVTFWQRLNGLVDLTATKRLHSVPRTDGG